jgi:L-ascorbate metabolism protein UlaG (beta-lactamase superfamily)
MKIIWLGHGSFRVELAGAVFLIDPWLSGPAFPKERRDEALAGATHILLTHGHGDHVGDVPGIAGERGLTVSCIPEAAKILSAQGVKTQNFNMGGTLKIDGAEVTMVPACHSSAIDTANGAVYAGTEAGFMIRGDGHCLYHSGDTGIMADMAWMGEYFRPDVGILSAGGWYTMDMKMAAWAARKYFDFKVVIPGHYRTFPILEQSAQALVDGLPGVRVEAPEVMGAVEI